MRIQTDTKKRPSLAQTQRPKSVSWETLSGRMTDEQKEQKRRFPNMYTWTPSNTDIEGRSETIRSDKERKNKIKVTTRTTFLHGKSTPVNMESTPEGTDGLYYSFLLPVLSAETKIGEARIGTHNTIHNSIRFVIVGNLHGMLQPTEITSTNKEDGKGVYLISEAAAEEGHPKISGFPHTLDLEHR